MSENKDTTLVENKQEEQNEFHFSKPYKFEGNSYEKINLSGLEELKAGDMVEASRYMNRIGLSTADEEMELPYALFIASRVTGQPLEFFMGLRPNDALRLKGRIVRFFFGQA